MHVHDSNFTGRKENNQSTKIQMGGDFRLKPVQRKHHIKIMQLLKLWQWQKLFTGRLNNVFHCAIRVVLLYCKSTNYIPSM